MRRRSSSTPCHKSISFEHNVEVEEEVEPLEVLDYKWCNKSEMFQNGLNFENCVLSEDELPLPLNCGLVNVVGLSIAFEWTNVFVADSERRVGHLTFMEPVDIDVPNIKLGNVLLLNMVVIRRQTIPNDVPFQVINTQISTVEVIDTIENIPYKYKWETFDSLLYRYAHSIMKYVKTEKLQRGTRQVVEVFTETSDGKSVRFSFWEGKAAIVNRIQLEPGKFYLFTDFHIADFQQPDVCDVSLNAKDHSKVVLFEEKADGEVEDTVELMDLIKSSTDHERKDIKLRLIKLSDTSQSNNTIFCLVSDGSLNSEGRYNSIVLKSEDIGLRLIPIGCYFDITVEIYKENTKLMLRGKDVAVQTGKRDGAVGRRQFICY